MNKSPIEQVLAELEGTDAEPICQTVGLVRGMMPGLDPSDLRRAIEALCELFYVDLADRPDLSPALAAAEEALVAAGEPTIPILIKLMEGSDIKSHMHLASVLGKIGPASLGPLRRVIATAEDPYSRSFALFAIGKIGSPVVHEALPEVVGALMHPDKEVRDSAARTLGKIAEAVPPGLLSERRRIEMHDALIRALGDPQPAVRAKAVRSLGKLASCGHLDPTRRRDLRSRLQALLERGEETDWDHAFIVRRQVKEALAHLGDTES